MLFKKKFEQTAGAIHYPERIIIETRNVIDKYSFYSTDDITILNTDISDTALAEAVMLHLSHSKMEANYSRELYKSYLKKAGFRSEAASRKDAKYLAIFRTNAVIRFEPRNNKISGGRMGAYYGMPDKISEISITADAEALGLAVRKSWDDCIFS
ncbi:MAG: hypothetical protein H7Y86_05825 [Rhizobacter sp.]|nr:hypothetical protein [Ferruginibacter sp.]